MGLFELATGKDKKGKIGNPGAMIGEIVGTHYKAMKSKDFQELVKKKKR